MTASDVFHKGYKGLEQVEEASDGQEGGDEEVSGAM